jgi:putative membrane protein
MIKSKGGDSLAINRTSLANERTLLAYFRTSLAFFASGAFLVRFFESPKIFLISIISIIFGFILFAYGIFNFVINKHKIIK